MSERPAPLRDLLTAVQFLTRIPIPAQPFDAGSLGRAVAWFPVVGVLVGAVGATVDRVLLGHLGPVVAALAAVATTVLLTGALHEDGLADAADAFGLMRSRERTLTIMRDSRIGTFGGCALVFSLVSRILLIGGLSVRDIFPALIAAHVLGRWSTLPLTRLPPARESTDSGAPGLGAQVAQVVSRRGLVLGSIASLVLAFAALRTQAIAPVCAALGVTAATGLFYRRRLGGVTGDCFGATNQLVEIAVLACLAWHRAA